MLLEYADNGNLYHYLKKHGGKGLDPKKISSMYIQIFDAVKFMHDNEILHRDIKPENILLDCDINPKICDFGWSTRIDKNKPRLTFCGTYEYMAPEIFEEEEYDVSVDVWSLGILLYEMWHGKSPFVGKSVFNIYRNILDQQIEFRSDIDKDAKDLIIFILQRKANDRPSVEDIAKHPYIIKSRKMNKHIRKDNYDFFNKDESVDEDLVDGEEDLIDSNDSQSYSLDDSSNDSNNDPFEMEEEMKDYVEFQHHESPQKIVQIESKRKKKGLAKSTLHRSEEHISGFKNLKSSSISKLNVKNVEMPKKKGMISNDSRNKIPIKSSSKIYMSHVKKKQRSMMSISDKNLNVFKYNKLKNKSKRRLQAKLNNKSTDFSSERKKLQHSPNMKKNFKSKMQEYVFKSSNMSKKSPKDLISSTFIKNNEFASNVSASLKIKIPNVSPNKFQKRRGSKLSNNSLLGMVNTPTLNNTNFKKTKKNSLKLTKDYSDADRKFYKAIKKDSSPNFNIYESNKNFKKTISNRKNKFYKGETKPKAEETGKGQNINIVINKFYDKAKFYYDNNKEVTVKNESLRKKREESSHSIDNKARVNSSRLFRNESKTQRD